MENLKAFKKLIKRYESITLEEIKTEFKKGTPINEIVEKLTGFGNGYTCSLCEDTYCFGCVYYTLTDRGCSDGINAVTYLNIYFADTPTKLRNAYRARAEHMKSILKNKS